MVATAPSSVTIVLCYFYYFVMLCYAMLCYGMLVLLQIRVGKHRGRLRPRNVRSGRAAACHI